MKVSFGSNNNRNNRNNNQNFTSFIFQILLEIFRKILGEIGWVRVLLFIFLFFVSIFLLSLASAFLISNEIKIDKQVQIERSNKDIYQFLQDHNFIGCYFFDNDYSRKHTPKLKINQDEIIGTSVSNFILRETGFANDTIFNTKNIHYSTVTIDNLVNDESIKYKLKFKSQNNDTLSNDIYTIANFEIKLIDEIKTNNNNLKSSTIELEKSTKVSRLITTFKFFIEFFNISNKSESYDFRTERLKYCLEEYNPVTDSSLAYVEIENQIWSAEDLSVTKFLNGDDIFHAKSLKDWKYVSENKIPAFCYSNSESKVGRTMLYNWHAVEDKRGLIPEGWRLPNSEDWEILFDNIQKKGSLNEVFFENDSVESIFKAKPTGICTSEFTFFYLKTNALWWKQNEEENKLKRMNVGLEWGVDKAHYTIVPNWGVAIRLIRERRK